MSMEKSPWRNRIEKAARAVGVVGMLGMSGPSHEQAPSEPSRTEEVKRAPSEDVRKAITDLKREVQAIAEPSQESEGKNTETIDTEEQREYIRSVKNELQNLDISSEFLHEISGSYDREVYGNLYTVLSADIEWREEIGKKYDLTKDEEEEIIHRLQEERVKYYEDIVDNISVSKTGEGIVVEDADSGFRYEAWIGEKADGEIELTEMLGDHYTQSLDEASYRETGDSLRIMIAAHVRNGIRGTVYDNMLEKEMGEGGRIEQLVESLGK